MTPVVSFDIDGTLEVGDPPGIVTIAMVRRIKLRGWLLGSCSDRPISYQQALWERLAIAPDFTVLKHRLVEVRIRFPAPAYYHIGDTEVDERYASGAGFEFLRADASAHASWGPRLLGSAADGGRWARLGAVAAGAAARPRLLASALASVGLTRAGWTAPPTPDGPAADGRDRPAQPPRS